MRKRRRWLFFACGVFLGGAMMLWMRRNAGQQAARSPQPAADSLLNLPPEQTVLARQEFLAAYRTGDRRRSKALYEEFLPRIGANGLRETIEGAYPACHDEGHDLGKVIFAKLGDVGTALESCADACASGCMHGVLMQFFTDTGGAPAAGGHHHSAQLTAADVAERIPTICESPAFTSRYSPGDCAHGVGHAVMFLSSYDIPASIELCERFSTYPLKYYCATGAYMEYRIVRSSSDYPIHGGLYPCDKALYPAACFRYVMTNTLREHYSRGGTLETLQQQCAGLREKYRLGCFHGLGNAHVTLVARRQKTLAQVCGSGSRNDQTACVEGAMERLGKFSPTVAADRCASLTDWRRAVCDAAAARKMYDMEKSFALYQR